MRVVFSKRASNDLRNIAAYSRREFGDHVATALEARVQVVIERLSESPQSAPKVEQRPHICVVSLGRYPYRLFYRISDEEVLVLHIRHAARRAPF